MALINRDQIAASKANALQAKVSGAGSSATSTKQSSANLGLIGGILGGVGGFITGGPAGAIAGAVSGFTGDSKQKSASSSPSLPNMTSVGRQLVATTHQAPVCNPPAIRVGSRCVDPTAALPGGRPFVSTAMGAAVMGAFGMPAMQPMAEQRRVLHCGPGMVLGKDNLCYPKALLSRRSKWRKWRQPPRPPVTSADVAAIRRAARARDRVAQLATDVGFQKPKRRK